MTSANIASPILTINGDYMIRGESYTFTVQVYTKDANENVDRSDTASVVIDQGVPGAPAISLTYTTSRFNEEGSAILHAEVISNSSKFKFNSNWTAIIAGEVVDFDAYTPVHQVVDFSKSLSLTTVTTTASTSSYISYIFSFSLRTIGGSFPAGSTPVFRLSVSEYGRALDDPFALSASSQVQ